MTNINGITTKEYKQFRDILIKCNRQQLSMLLKAIQYEMLKRT